MATLAPTPLAERSLADLPKTFGGLNRLHALRPIHDDDALDAATAVALAMAGHDLNEDQDDYLDTLSTLIEEYEREHHPAPRSKASVPQRIKYVCEQAGVNGSELGRIVGNVSLGSKLLRGEREPTKTQAVKLGRHFKLNPAYFMFGDQ